MAKNHISGMSGHDVLPPQIHGAASHRLCQAIEDGDMISRPKGKVPGQVEKAEALKLFVQLDIKAQAD